MPNLADLDSCHRLAAPVAVLDICAPCLALGWILVPGSWRTIISIILPPPLKGHEEIGASILLVIVLCWAIAQTWSLRTIEHNWIPAWCQN